MASSDSILSSNTTPPPSGSFPRFNLNTFTSTTAKASTLNSHSNTSPNAFLSTPDLALSDSSKHFKTVVANSAGLNATQRYFNLYHGNRRSSRACHERAGGCEPAAVSPQDNVPALIHHTSMPALRGRGQSSIWPGVHWTKRSHCANDADNLLRRWTLPRKAPCITAPTQFEAVVTKQEHRGKFNSKTSPAMITLRRSTNGNTQDSKLTFFPPPSFSNGPVNFMSYLLPAEENQRYSTTSSGHVDHRTRTASSADRSASISLGTIQPTIVTPANSMLTEVQTNAYFTDANMTRNARRCSTKYISRSSVYEVLWDAGDLSSSRSSSAEFQVNSTAVPPSHQVDTGRRASLAVDQLEIQLAKPDPEASQPRKKGPGTQHRLTTPEI